MSGATSWNSELPSGRNPYWIKDEALADIGLHPGDLVGVDTGREPAAGDLVLAEVETDELADRLARRYQPLADGRVRLVAASEAWPDLVVEADQLLLLGVVCTRVRFSVSDTDTIRVIEEPLA